MQLILSIYHVICSVTSKINIKNSAKFNIRSTSRLTYDIISQLHLPQNGYFMERSNFLVAIIKLILRSLAIIPRLVRQFRSWDCYIPFLSYGDMGERRRRFFIYIRW